MTIGIPRTGIVLLAEHSPSWAVEYARERDRLLGTIGANIQGIEHVGSTAVPGLCAKPVIDITVAVEHLSEAEGLAPAMERIGYDYRGDVGVPGERLFGRGPKVRTHLVHVVVADDEPWRNYLAFRDALRADAELAAEYDALKRALAEEFPADRPSYTAAKSPFIEGVLRSGKRAEDHAS